MSSRGPRSRCLVLALTILAAALTASTAWAQTPDVITFQGRLSNAQNAQPVTACLNMTFRIYTSQSVQSPIWAEGHTGANCIQVTNGQFNADLGSLTSFSSAGLLFDQQYFLGIQVGSDSEMNPRKPFTSVGYALHAVKAQNSDHANNSDHSNNSDNANNSGHANNSDNAGHATSADIAAHAISADNATHATSSDNATHATSANNALSADSAFQADRAYFTQGVMEAKVAEVMAGLRGGDTPPPGSAVYTSPVAALDDVATWCGMTGPLNPCVIKIMPGVYDLGAADVFMLEYVDIVGSGADVTRISTSATIHAADHSQLRFLTLEKRAGLNPLTTLLSVASGSPRIDHMIISAPGPSSNTVTIDGSSPDIDEVTFEGCAGGMVVTDNNASPRISNSIIRNKCGATSSGNPVGLGIRDSSPILTNVRIEVTYMVSGGKAVGISNTNGAKPILENVQVSVDTGGLPGQANGIETVNSSPTLRGVSIRATSTSSGGASGIDSQLGSVVELDHSVIVSSKWSIVSDATGEIRVGVTKLVGPIGGVFGAFKCVGAYDGNYVTLDASCK